MRPVTGRHRLGLFLALAATLLWGALPIALKALLAQMDAPTITWYRFLAAAVLLGAWLAARGRLPRLRGLGRPGWTILALAALGLLGNYILFLVGLQRVSPSTSQVVVALAPLLMLLGALALFGERFRALQWAGLVALCAGLLLFFNRRLPELAKSLEGESAGVLLVVASAVAWAAYGLAQKQLLAWLEPAGILLVIYLAGGLCFGPPARQGALLALDGAGLLLLAFCAINTLLAYGCFAESLAHWEASRVSAVLALTPLATIGMTALAAVWFPGHVAPERLGGLSLLGAAFVAAGSAACALGRGAPAHQARLPAPVSVEQNT